MLNIPEYRITIRGHQLQPSDTAVGVAIITALSCIIFILHKLSSAQKQKPNRPSTPDLEKDRRLKPARKFGGTFNLNYLV